MRKVRVAVVEDPSHPEGGYAVLLLHEVAQLPDGATFRLKPVEARGSAGTDEAESWPQGELRPRALRLTEMGIELVVGPEIVDSPALLPGTLGVIEIRAAGIRGEFLWPSIRPTARPRRRNLTVVKSQPQRNTVQPAIPAGIAKPAATREQAGSAGAAGAIAPAAGRRVMREASGGAIASCHQLGEQEAVPVTALDHAAPAAATVAQAVGSSVVQLSAVREGVGAARSMADAHQSGMSGPQSSGQSVGGKPAALVPRPASGSKARRLAAIAASLAVVVSGAFLLLGQIQDTVERAVHAKREAAQVVPRAEAMPHHEAQELAQVGAAATGPTSLPREPDPGSASAPPAEPAAEPAVAAALSPPVSGSTPVQEVTLRMRGGGFQITGELKGFDGTKYLIATRAAGVLTMDAARFECVGEACGRPVAAILPLSERPSPVNPDVIRIEGAAALTGSFIAQLIRDYALSIGASASEQPREAGAGVARYRLSDPRGVELATIEVHDTGVAAALAAVERGAAAIALVDKPLAAETEPRALAGAAVRGRRPAARQPAAQTSEIVVGLDGIAAVAAPQTAPASISLDLLGKVLAGQITDWYELGQPPGPIHLYLPPEGSGALDTLARQVLRPRGLDFARTARRMPSESEAADAAARDPRGIALVSLAARREAKVINLETTCGLVVRPTAFTVKTGEYPLVRRLSLQLPAQLAQPSARGLARIAQSGEIGNAVAAGRFVDQSISALPVEEQAERMAWAANAPASAFDAAELRQMLGDLANASRLSVTFRFVSGTNELDQRSRREVQRVAEALKEPELAGKRLILAGFTDAGGRFQANMAAAARRAGQVRSALLAAAGPGFDGRLVQTKGYGPLAPVACGGSPEGTRLNRRVEVWIAG